LSDTTELKRISETLDRIATLLSRATSATEPTLPGLGTADAYHWRADGTLLSINKVNRVPVDLLMGIDDLRDLLLRNTLQFARGHGANTALLWGARGMGKSSLVKAIHAHVGELVGAEGQRLVLIEINREDIETLPRLMRAIAAWEARVIVFCDDLSFDRDEASYKSLKTILDGGLEGRPDNVVFYATSNRRHLMPRDMIDNERTSAINPNEAIDEKISLSDRFGLWLGFHHCDQDTYLKMIRSYVEHYGLTIGEDDLRARAIEWAATRGGRSGRVAIQFVRDLAGELGRTV
jgi:predicted AAA+ superfamily ATPase